LHKERYRVDAEAGLAPIDLGVGWGPLSTARSSTSSILQMGRWFYLEPEARRLRFRAR
jgi:hypothetical protein